MNSFTDGACGDPEIARRERFMIRRRAMAAAAVAVCALGIAGCDKPGPDVPFHGVDITGANYAKDFRLKDPQGRERTLADFRGKAVMRFFGFTQCPDVCPTALFRAAEVKRLLGADGDRLQVLFVTIDPERDTPKVLNEYTAAFDPEFIGLHGTLEQTDETARAFKAYYKKVPTGTSYTMDHSALSYVYDPQGNIRLALRHNLSAQEFAADLRQILHPS